MVQLFLSVSAALLLGVKLLGADRPLLEGKAQL